MDDSIFAMDLDSAYGMFCLWDVASYHKICTIDDWERRFSSPKAFGTEIFKRHIVPIYFYGCGQYRFELRPFCFLSKEETSNNPLISQPYLFQTSGLFALSGMEYIGSSEAKLHRLLVKGVPGLYQVKIILLPKSDTEEPHTDVIVSMESPVSSAYRTKINTFYPLD